MRQGTHFITNDEPAWELYESVRVAPNGDGSTGRRRFQIITVIRGEAFADYTVDMGPATSTEPFAIRGGWQDPDTKKVYIEETVGRLRDFAEKFRYRLENDFYARETIPFRDIQKEFTNEMEAREKNKKHPNYTQIAT